MEGTSAHEVEADSTGREDAFEREKSPTKSPVSVPQPFIHVDDNIILCDDNLVKEAKVWF